MYNNILFIPCHPDNHKLTLKTTLNKSRNSLISNHPPQLFLTWVIIYQLISY